MEGYSVSMLMERGGLKAETYTFAIQGYGGIDFVATSNTRLTLNIT